MRESEGDKGTEWNSVFHAADCSSDRRPKIKLKARARKVNFFANIAD